MMANWNWWSIVVDSFQSRFFGFFAMLLKSRDKWLKGMVCLARAQTTRVWATNQPGFIRFWCEVLSKWERTIIFWK